MPLMKLWKKIISPKKTRVKKSTKKANKKAAKRPAEKVKKKSLKPSKDKAAKRISKKAKKTSRKPAKIKKLKKTAKIPKRPVRKDRKEEIGVVIHYFSKISVGIIKLKKPLKAGDKIHIKGAHTDFKQTVKSIQHNHKDIALAKKGLEVGIKVSRLVHENNKVYRI